jgi:hypothetical protein
MNQADIPILCFCQSHILQSYAFHKQINWSLSPYLQTSINQPINQLQAAELILEKLTVSQLANELPAFHGTELFITQFTTAHHLSLS